MKRLSSLLIAASAALAVTAMMGSASASATVLCKTPEHTCPKANVLPSGSWLTYGQSGGVKVETLALKTSGGKNYHCGYVLMGEQSTEENATPLHATGQRVLSECASGSEPVKMAMSESTDSMYALVPNSGVIATTPVSIVIAEGFCIYSGSMVLRTYRDGEEAWVEDVEGEFTYVSGAGKAICGGATATLSSQHLYLATESYIESSS